MKNLLHGFLRIVFLIVIVFVTFLNVPLASANPTKVLYTFQSGSDGNQPWAGVIFDNSGAMYGTTLYGGTGTLCNSQVGCGTVYKLAPPTNPGGAWTETVLYSFTGGVDGGKPFAPLIRLNGALYGTASAGGQYGAGVVFKLTPPSGGGGAWTETAIYSFTGGIDGNFPLSGLVADSTGALYGTTDGGGQYDVGVVFKLTSQGGIWSETVLYSFQGGTDGGFPSSSLIFDGTGALYGEAGEGGDQNCVPPGNTLLGCGVVFKLALSGGSWTETVLYSFHGGGDGCYRTAGLVFDPAGVLYGVTDVGGYSPCTNPEDPGGGVVFALTPSGGNWTESVLYTFTQASGVRPRAGLTIDSASNLYGTTPTAVYKLTNSGGGWTETTLHQFQSVSCYAPVALRKGRIYGTSAVEPPAYGGVFAVVP